MKLELPHAVPQKTGLTVVECMTGPLCHVRLTTWPPPPPWLPPWPAFRDGMNPKAGPAAMLGGPPAAVAVPAAATTAARHRTAIPVTATIDVRLISPPVLTSPDEVVATAANR